LAGPRLSESDPPALRCKALRAGGGQTATSIDESLEQKEAIPLGLAPGADPEGDSNQAKVQPEGLFADIVEIIAEFTAWGCK